MEVRGKPPKGAAADGSNIALRRMQAMKAHRLFHLFVWLVLALASVGVRAQASGEPTVHDIYQAASQGDLPKAQAMIDEVIRRHPGSAKAHYVKAELAARGKDAATARSELQTAERLAPGLPFAQPAAVSALRTELDRLSAAATPTRPRDAQRQHARGMGAPPPGEVQPQTADAGFPLGRILLFGLIALGVLAFVMRRRAARDSAPAAPYAGGTAFGRGYGADVPPGPYPGQPGMGPGYPPGPVPPQGGMGSSIARGLGTGLAVGAGVVAAQEIGRRMFDHERDGRAADGSGLSHHPDNEHSQLARDAGLGVPDAPPDFDMGGQDFGVQGDGGWDDAGDVGGGDWDT
jgi:uncharacterized protein